MKLKDGMDALPTVSGLICSILLSAMMILYTCQKFDVLINKKGGAILSSVETSAIPDTFEQNVENGLKIAVAFAKFDNNPEPILEKELGRVVLKKYYWGKHANGTSFSGHDEVPSHFCNQEELGLAEYA